MEFLPILELIDRLCIARVKFERTKGANQTELDWYEDTPELEENIKELTEIHNEIWNLEWQLKSGVEDQLSLEEIGRRAIRIRDHNNKRIAFKNKTAELVGSIVREIKVDHLSQ
jgi:hypothetical protein